MLQLFTLATKLYFIACERTKNAYLKVSGLNSYNFFHGINLNLGVKLHSWQF
jgi:hypothetical protein